MTEESKVEVKEVAPDIEDKARKFGWVPKEEFHGDVETWRDADEFVKRGDEILGYVRKDRDKALEKAQKAENEIISLKATMSDFRKFTEAAEDRAYARALADLKADRAKAIELGDGTLVNEIEDEIDKIKEEKKSLTTNQPTQPDPNLAANKVALENWFSEGNELFKTDIEVGDMAAAFAEIIRKDPNLNHIVGTDFLDEVAKRVKKALPEKFENLARTKAAAVGSSTDAGTGRGGSKKRGYADLPDDAKRACDDFVSTKIDGKPLMSQEDYVKKYFEGGDK